MIAYGWAIRILRSYRPCMAVKTKRKPARSKGLTYAESGVSIAAGDKFVGSIGSLLRRTHGQRVIDNPGGFAGLFRLDYNEQLFKHNHKEPVLVACADGVGTKVHLAIEMNKHDTVGIDLVAMNVNDLIVQGAEPLLFLDYIAVNTVDQDVLYDIVKGISEGCKQAGCALIGGETAEMNDLYKPNDYDLAGFSVGVVELKKATNPLRVEPGDVIIGLESSGVHSNGYSLVRKVIKHANLKLNNTYPELNTDRTLGEVLLEPTRIYADSIVKLLRAYKVKKIISGMAHITGGGMEGNLNRAIHDQVDATIDENAWTVPAVFDLIQEKGQIDEAEMRVVFNMGIGYTLIVRPTFADAVVRRLEKSGEQVHVIGKITKGSGKVKIKNRKK